MIPVVGSFQMVGVVGVVGRQVVGGRWSYRPTTRPRGRPGQTRAGSRVFRWSHADHRTDEERPMHEPTAPKGSSLAHGPSPRGADADLEAARRTALPFERHDPPISDLADSGGARR